MTTFTQIGGYGVHPPPSEYLVVQYKIPEIEHFLHGNLKMIAHFKTSLQFVW